MRTSRFPLGTIKEAPADAELASHRLMLRAGYIRRQAAGIYTWLPLGLRVLRKVEAVIREEMNRAGAVELAMPVLASIGLEQRRAFLGRLRRVIDADGRVTPREFVLYVVLQQALLAPPR